MSIKRGKILTSMIVGVCIAFQIGTTAFAVDSRNDMNTPQAIKNQKTKPELEKMKKAEVEFGFTEFWGSIDPTEMSNYYFNDDGTVSLKDVSNLSEDEKKKAEKKLKEFEKKFQTYMKKIDQYNKKLGVNRKAIDSIEGGQLNIGDSTGSGNFNTKIIYEDMHIGDVLLGSLPGASFQGWMEHAGMYNGVKTDKCIWSIPGNNKVAQLQSKDAWGWEFNEIWVMNADSPYKYSAYQHAYQSSAGDYYDWLTNKTDHSWWYCSKIPYVGYYEECGVNIDGILSDGLDYWVLPSDIYNSNKTSVKKKYVSS